ncbi:MAG: bacteriohemerythrin [Rhodospirillales bacterium]|nr:bacteriohemerythrin [Rhodospirillales bacterium]
MLNAASEDEVVTGIAIVDKDHKILVGLLNDMLSACFASQGPAVLAGILEELLSYSRYHFEHEESLLEKMNYARLEEHKAEHRNFIAQVEKIRKGLEGGANHELSNDTLEFLGNWLSNHIKTEDMEFCKILKQQGAN